MNSRRALVRAKASAHLHPRFLFIIFIFFKVVGLRAVHLPHGRGGGGLMHRLAAALFNIVALPVFFSNFFSFVVPVAGNTGELSELINTPGLFSRTG